MTLTEVKAILEEVRLNRSGETEELGYELRRAIRHAELFASQDVDSAKSMVNELLEHEKITPEIATKIVDIKPLTRDEVRAIYAKERFTLSEDELDGILDVVLRG